MSLDIEMSIRRGKLDVGVFAPSNMVDHLGAKQVLDDLETLLIALGNDDEEHVDWKYKI